MLILLITTQFSPARAEDASEKLGKIYAIIDAYDRLLLPEDRKEIDDLVGGISTGLLWANAMLEKRQQPLLYCQPRHLTLTGTQVIDMMRRAMKDNPKWRDFALGEMVLVTLQRTFPC